MKSRPGSILLDKGVVKRVYENRARLADGRPPTLAQAEAAGVYFRLRALNLQLYITRETENVLLLRPPAYAARILSRTQALRKGRYLRRWARRLRDYVFTREDAIIIAYASFGVDLAVGKLGVDAIVTTDLHLARNFHTRHSEIQKRFDLMIENLPEPYHKLTLPEAVTPAIVLSKW